MDIRHRENLFLILVFAFICVIGFPHLGMPGFWDEPKVYLKPLFDMYDSFFGYFSSPLTNTLRPPGIHFLYLPFLWIFGPHMPVIRLLDILYFCSGIFFFYKVFRAEDEFLAKLATLFVILTPIIQVYSFQYVGEPQLFTLMALYLYLLKFQFEKLPLLFLTGVFLGLCRENSLALIPASVAMLYLSGEKRGRAYLCILGPLVGSALYWHFTFLKTGSIFFHLTLDQGHIDLLRDPLTRFEKILKTFVLPYRLVPLLLTSAFFFFAGRKWNKPAPLTGFLFIFTGSFLFVFSGHIFAISRYFYAAFPFFVFLLLMPLKPFLKSHLAKAGILVLVLVPPFLLPAPITKDYQDSWAYPKVLELQLKAIREVKENWPVGSVIMTSWPFLEMLKLKYGGYGPHVNYELPIEPIGDNLPDVFLYTNYPRQLDDEELKKIIESGRYREQFFSYRDYQIRLFQKVRPR